MPAANLPDPSTWQADRVALNKAVRTAGAAVLNRFKDRADGKILKSWTKADNSPVTDADHEANEILYHHLIQQHGGGYGFLSEESIDTPERLNATRIWVIDPIDGTRAFLSGDPHFTVCAALIENGKAVAAAVFNPALNEFFEAGLGQGALLNGKTITASSCGKLEDCRMLAKQVMFDFPGWPRKWPTMQIIGRNSTNYRMALVAAGTGDAVLALVKKADWDSAPGALIAQEAGAVVTDHLGRNFIYNQPDPRQTSLVCAAPSLYPHILERVSHLPETILPVSKS